MHDRPIHDRNTNAAQNSELRLDANGAPELSALNAVGMQHFEELEGSGLRDLDRLGLAMEMQCRHEMLQWHDFLNEPFADGHSLGYDFLNETFADGHSLEDSDLPAPQTEPQNRETSLFSKLIRWLRQ